MLFFVLIVIYRVKVHCCLNRTSQQNRQWKINSTTISSFPTQSLPSYKSESIIQINEEKQTDLSSRL